MLLGNGWRAWVGMAMGVALVLPAVGCGHKSRLADRCAELPAGVEMPEGFYPLKGHTDFADADQSYNGWPRYIVSSRDGMVMCYVPTQRFMMGGGTQVDEVPARTAVVNHFYIDMTEVSNIQFKKFAKAEKRRGKCAIKIDDYCDYYTPGLNDSHPVRNVSWSQAAEYAEWVGKYLPTEAQWEAAARGADRRIYPWGNDPVSETTRFLCNAQTGTEDYDGYAQTAPVMNFAGGVSPFGAFNMSGNVWEWCDDSYDPGRYAYPSSEDPGTGLARGAKAFGDVNYPNPLEKDVLEARVGPLRGDEKVVRGGSFALPIERCRVDSRAGARPGVHQNDIGFRCVLTLPPDDQAAE